MTQSSLLEICERPRTVAKAKPKPESPADNLTRCEGKYAPVIAEWFRTKQPGDEYHLAELANYCYAQLGQLTESPGRIMRLLRTKGVIDYEVVCQPKSLYRVVSVPPVLEEEAA